ncbi:MAG TPA: hypothetical protein VKF16_01040 [Candidatus Dormibacteraeota bacterium]|nr:hypothetical protein [Candidatus Dormibacteraeota bacterium]
MNELFPLIFVPVLLVVYAVGLLVGSMIAGFGLRLGWEFAGRRNRPLPPPQS